MSHCNKEAMIQLMNNDNCSIQHHQQQEGHGEDRLSYLPDSLLITILSLLPLDSAAATSVLSHRWRHLWTHLTHITLPPDGLYIPHDYITTMHHIISQLTSPKIHSFHLRLPDCLPYSIYHPEFSRSILQICGRNPDIIKVCFIRPAFFMTISSIELPLPICILQTKSLLHLELTCKFDLKFDFGVPINLPNLKKLHILLYESHRLLVSILFKSCPKLEHLTLKLCLKGNNHHDPYIVDIVTPNLTWLQLNLEQCFSDHCKFVIDAPNLELFESHGALPFYKFVKYPSKLLEARISVSWIPDRNHIDFVSIVQGILHGISCARSLILYDCALLLLSSFDGIAVPMFRNLVHLRVSCDEEYCVDARGWTPRLTGCLLSEVKSIEFRNVVGNDDIEMKLLLNLLTHPIALEQLHVSFYKYEKRTRKQYQLWYEYNFFNKLFTLSRSSLLHCRIEFSGNSITASSDDFRNCVSACQILNQ